MQFRNQITMIVWLVALSMLAASSVAAEPDFVTVAKEIDRRLSEHWQAKNITPAAEADEATQFRRLMLDLTGRIPTRSEWETRLKTDKDQKPFKDRYPQVFDDLLKGPEFPLHFGTVLDELLQGSAAGNAEFTDYLRTSLRAGKRWDALFRELMVGPWDTAEKKAATHFLGNRSKDLDKLTTDATRVFFGVDVSCARCHDHPLVNDWKQDHYYGMASFFNRTTGGKGSIGEKNEGDVTFKGADGTQQTAKVMFLTGTIVSDEPAKAGTPTEEGKKPKVSRREQLVAVALADQKFLSRSLINRVWHYLLGRGLVHPVDQMHSANPPTVPGLLEWLADDFAASGYDVQRLIGGIVTSKAYRLSSKWEHSSSLPEEGDFAVRRLRILSPRQFAFSVLVATGRADFSEPSAMELRAEKLAGNGGTKRVQQYLAAEQQATALLAQLDPIESGQTSAAEAMFLSNNPAIQKLFAAEEGTLAAKLAALEKPADPAESAIRGVYCRAPQTGEAERLSEFLSGNESERRTRCEQLVWALVTSAEFRFQH